MKTPSFLRLPLSMLQMGYDMDDRYAVDPSGVVYFNKPSKFRKKVVGDVLKPFINRYGYVEYLLTNRTGKRVHIQAHRLVACMFIPNTENKKYVNHIDGDKTNNHVSNLEWCTCSENELHSYKVLGKTPWNKGISLPSGKEYRGKIRPVVQKNADGGVVREYFNPTEAESYGFDRKQISAACLGRIKTYKGYTWQYI